MHRRLKKFGLFALVALLHLAVGWVLLTTGKMHPRTSTEAATLVLLTLPRPPPRSVATIAQPVAKEQAITAPNPRAPEQRPSGPGAATTGAVHEDKGPRPGATIDWSAELAAVAQGRAAEAPAAPRDFGFPKNPPRPPAVHEFGWDRTHTQRVESIDGGGLLIHLNDRCVLVLFPWPFAGCGIGKKPANGDLFEHMHDADGDGDGGGGGKNAQR